MRMPSHLLGGGNKDGGLAISPGMTHYDILSSGFLDTQMR